MATVTGLTAARMQEIIDQQISSGAIDLSGHLIFTREDGSTFDAGVAKGAKGDPANYPVSGFPSGAVSTYVRLATLDGINDTNGAGMQFILSGIGNYGSAKRGTVLVHVGQRGADLVDVRAWSFGLDQVAANSIRLYTRKIGTFLFEVWALLTTYTSALTLQDLSKWRATINLDGNTTVAPSDLVEWSITRTDSPASSQTVAGLIEIATNAEVQTGTDALRAVTPAGLSARTATDARTGIAELATNAEALGLVDSSRIITPATLAHARRNGAVGRIPSSVAVGSGSATVDADGTVRFTNVSSVSLNGVFDGVGSDVYEILLRCTNSATGATITRLRAAGVDRTSTYNYVGQYNRNASGPTRYSVFGATYFGLWWSNVAALTSDVYGRMTLFHPGLNSVTMYEMASYVGASDRYQVVEGGDLNAPGGDGITILTNGVGVLNGWIKVIKKG